TAHAPGHDCALAACLARRLPRCLFWDDEGGLANPDVLAGTGQAGFVHGLRWRQLLAVLVVGRTEHCILFIAQRQHRDLHGWRGRRNSRRLTESKAPDVSPTWNPKTNAQIAWVSGRTGLPQI